MKTRYTAKEMREMALVEESYGWDVVAKMLRQAADMMERDGKYEYTAEYVKKRSGKVVSKCVYHFKSFDEAKRFKYYPLKNEKLRFIRRKVGEWETVC